MMQLDNIDKYYGIPKEEISCPSCGLKYGHHKTKVCKKCELCTSCVKDSSPCDICKDKEIITAKDFIENVLGFQPL